MKKLSKKQKEWKKKIDPIQKYTLEEAVKLIKEFSDRKFVEGVDISFRLGVDPRKSDQMVRGTCLLPHGTGKEVRVLVFAQGEKAEDAKAAGADFVGGADLVEKIQGGWLEFDRVVATPDMMAHVGKIGKILGPRGLMPNPKVGTVTFEVSDTIKNIKLGQVQFKVDKGANLQMPAGKAAFDDAKLIENIKAAYDAVLKLKPSTAKGTYFKNISISSTMGPGVKVSSNEFI